MAGWKDFREIGAWQRACELQDLAEQLLERPAFKHDFGFRDQLLDAARSAPRNIAEGFARFKHKEFAQFARVAKGSEAEVLNHFIDAHQNGHLSAEEFGQYEHKAKIALKAVNGLIWYLESTPDPPPRTKWTPKSQRTPKPKAP